MTGPGAERNLTYRQLRAPARQGAYTVGQLVALAVSGLLAVVVAAALVRLGAPVGLALSGGVLLAGAVPMAALALEGREFSIIGFLRALVAWLRAPRHYPAGPGTAPARGYHVRAAAEPAGRTSRSHVAAEPSGRTRRPSARSAP